ncbi:hypothetical protein SAMN02927914_00430 [Mesorhizobium qingshengii]|jgi:hypothetical protein|uniref:Uncharacterized protein n=1 Tax=Mesorhizobium qingshengii TaxID=1165689 RepID=A0A1G5VBR4_9HYPH|nr:hypothetical protein SAMN02927914_00430 [Mesorhizobium qingshengii]
MPAHKEDYRTNRADYAIAATRGRPLAEAGDREALLASKKKSLWLKQRRSLKLAENPMDSSPLPKRTSRG